MELFIPSSNRSLTSTVPHSTIQLKNPLVARLSGTSQQGDFLIHFSYSLNSCSLKSFGYLYPFGSSESVDLLKSLDHISFHCNQLFRFHPFFIHPVQLKSISSRPIITYDFTDKVFK